MKQRNGIAAAIFVAGAHLALVGLFALLIDFGLGGEGRLLWALWLPIDFPVSLLVDLGFSLIPDGNRYLETLRAWWPMVVHGVFGSLWWFVATVVVVRAIKCARLRSKRCIR
jgi:hypothetical protein